MLMNPTIEARPRYGNLCQSGHHLSSGLSLLGSAFWMNQFAQGGTGVQYGQVVFQTCLVKGVDVNKFDSKQSKGIPPDNRQLNFDRHVPIRDLYKEVQVLLFLRSLCHSDHTSGCTEIDDVAFRMEQFAEDQHWHHRQDSPMCSMFPGHESALSGF